MCPGPGWSPIREENRWFSAVRGSSAGNRLSKSSETIQKLHFWAYKSDPGHPGGYRVRKPWKFADFPQNPPNSQILENPSMNNPGPHCRCRSWVSNSEFTNRWSHNYHLRNLHCGTVLDLAIWILWYHFVHLYPFSFVFRSIIYFEIYSTRGEHTTQRASLGYFILLATTGSCCDWFTKETGKCC